MMQNLTIQGREFTAVGPSIFGGYTLTGTRGASYLATRAYINDQNTFKVISWNGHELRINGNMVRLTDVTGELVEVK